MVDALVEHDYIAKNPLELTIKKGDIIRDVIKKQDGWLEGFLRDKRGMFPDTFVRTLDKEPAVVYRNKKDVTRIRQCRVAFSYKQDHEDELNLSVGDIIDVLGEEEEGWWRGVLNGKEGVFPSNFVVEIAKSGSKENLNSDFDKLPSLPPKPTKLLCEVKYSYTAENNDELSIKEGDVVTVISQDGTDPGWWLGELNGRTGVFPDNFVIILPNEHHQNDKRHSKDHPAPKPSSVASQRKSLEQKQENDVSNKTTPPLPGKKPLLPIKKSPSGSSSSGGLFSGIKKKLVDAVDGASSSKGASNKMSESKPEISETASDNAFDQVERRPLLADVRATRAKAPGRRPPSVVFKEGEPGIVNGNMDHTNLDTLNEQLSTSNSSIDQESAEQKPKLREWEKHKAPWLEEMKLNQAKRTSTSPGPEQNKLKLTPTEKTEPDEIKPAKAFEKESSAPVDVPKAISGVYTPTKMKTPPNELEKSPTSVMMRNKANVLPPSVRPQTIQTMNDAQIQKPVVTSKIATPISHVSKTPSPGPKPQAAERTSEGNGDSATQETVSHKQYAELLERIQRLEKQNQSYSAAIDELRGQLQIETEMRMLLQAELDKVAQCVMQV